LKSSGIKTEGRSVRELKNIMIDQFELMTETDAKEVVDVLSELNNPRVMEEINMEVDKMNKQLESKTCGDQNNDDTYLCLSQSEPNSPTDYLSEPINPKLINMNRGNESDGYESDIYVESVRKPGSKEHIDFSTDALENIRRIVSRNKTSKKKASPKSKSPKSKSPKSKSPKSKSPKSKSPKSKSPKSKSPKSKSPKSK